MPSLPLSLLFSGVWEREIENDRERKREGEIIIDKRIDRKRDRKSGDNHISQRKESYRDMTESEESLPTIQLYLSKLFHIALLKIYLLKAYK